MTELMKRYWNETGKDDYVAWLELQNLLLKLQLTWHPVSEKPEKEGWYLCKVLYIDDTIGEETVYFDGESFLWHAVVRWLPIPPAPEGEAK